jgi:hypothetical protein
MGWLTLERSLTAVIHVGFVDDGAPVVMPMIGKMGQYEDHPWSVYIHGNTLTESC